MAIAKNPNRYPSNSTVDPDQAAEQFIAQAGGGAAPAPAAVPSIAKRKTPIMIRFDPRLLKQVDAAAKHRGISRSSWIQYVISRALDDGQG